jgi:16S rRNA (uracil1498-N3)-methyltransferase
VTSTGWAAAAGAPALAFVDELPTAAQLHWIEGPDGHHLQRVRRLDVDEAIVLADGAGSWVLARVAASRDGGVGVVAGGTVYTEPVPTPTLTVAFAPAKRDHGSEVTHQLVELGVDRIVPLRTDRAVVRWDGERGRKHVERLRRVAREAAMQCQRAQLPEVAEPMTVPELPRGASVLLADPNGTPITPASLPKASAWTVLVGPEGGFSPSEIASLGDVARIAVGPHVLRSVTAPVAVAAACASVRDTRSATR